MGIGELLNDIMGLALDRSIAKKPVMTIGYGSDPERLHSTLLTHNKEQSGIHDWVAVNPKDGSKLCSEEENKIFKVSREKRLGQVPCLQNGCTSKFHIRQIAR